MDETPFLSDDFYLVRNFFVALFIGALIGFERERHAKGQRQQFGGLRTFVLCALFGALAGWIDSRGGPPLLLIAGLIVLSILLVASLLIESRHSDFEAGMTTEISAVVTYLLGGAVTLGHAEVAVMLAIAVLALLAFKQPLHGVVRAVDREDMLAGLKLMAASFIILPLLPNRALDPWQALNPYHLWLLVVLISAMSLVGYVAVRLLGPRRGFALTGVFGGLASSTAVTLSFAKQSRGTPGMNLVLAMGALLAWTIMLVRVVIEVAVVNASLLRELMPSIGAMFVVSLLTVGWFARAAARQGSGNKLDAKGDPTLKNPFSLMSAIKFGIFFAVILLIVRMVELYMPNEWLYGVAALAGATDVDAITLSLAGASSGDLAPHVAVLGILIAVWSNTVLKCILVFVLGDRRLAVQLSVASVLSIGAGVVAFAAST